MSRTNFHNPKDVRAIEVRLYLMTNSTDPDQMASSEAIWSGSTLFAKTGHDELSKRRVKKRVSFKFALFWRKVTRQTLSVIGHFHSRVFSGKTMEHTVTSNLSKLYELQYSFHDRRSYETQLIQQIKGLERNLTSGEQTDLFLLFTLKWESKLFSQNVCKAIEWNVQCIIEVVKVLVTIKMLPP